MVSSIIFRFGPVLRTVLLVLAASLVTPGAAASVDGKLTMAMDRTLVPETAPLADESMVRMEDLSSMAMDTLQADTIRLEEIEVTVLRTRFDRNASPMAVSVLTDRELRRGRGGVFLSDALAGLPGVQVQNRYNPAVGERLAVRGFGGRAQFGVRGVRVLVDGIPATLPDGQSTLDHLDLGSAGRVEVLRGPASSLFGNASGGVLVLETRRPGQGPQADIIELETTVGSHGLARGQATASGRSGEIEWLVSGSAVTWEGFRTRSGGPEDGQSTYGASDRLGFNGQLRLPLAGGDLAVTANILDLDAENPGSLPAEGQADPDRPAWGFNVVQRASKTVEQAQGGVRWTGPVGSWGLDLSTYGIRRTVVNPIPSDIIDLDRRASGLRIEASREGLVEVGDPANPGRIRGTVGLEAQGQWDDRLNTDNDGGTRGEMTLDQAERVRSLGLFAQGVLPLPVRIGPRAGEVLAGLRWDRHDFRARDRMDREGDGEFPATGDRSMDAVSPSVGVSLPLAATLDAFGSVSSFFETPSTTELANRPGGAGGFNPELEPQRGTAVEAGLRGRFGERLRWEVVGHRTAIRNELVAFEVPDTPGRTFFRNAGSSRYQGAEVSADLGLAELAVPMEVQASWTWTDARFRTFEDDGEDLGGNRVPGIAPHRARLAVTANPEAGFMEVVSEFRGKIPVNDRNTEFTDSHVLLELKTGLASVEAGGVALSPWVGVQNLLDRTHTASVVVNAFGGRYFEPGPGRSFQAGLRATF